MRECKTLDLAGAVGKLTVHELTVGHVRRLVAAFKKADDMDVMSLLTDNFSELESYIDGCLVFEHENVSIDDLAFSELEQVKDALLAVNQSFLKTISMLGLDIGLAPQLKPKPTIKKRRKT